jgi:hypothetical protein
MRTREVLLCKTFSYTLTFNSFNEEGIIVQNNAYVDTLLVKDVIEGNKSTNLIYAAQNLIFSKFKSGTRFLRTTSILKKGDV